MLAVGKLFAGQILAQNHSTKPPIVLELVGDVGAGKTTFTRGLAAGLGITDPITSPSFLISKRYQLAGSGELVHYDFYHLNDMNIMRAELSETLALPGRIIVVEWAGSIAELLPTARITVNFQLNDDSTRQLVIDDHSVSDFTQIIASVENLWKTCGKNLEKSGKDSAKCAKTLQISGKPVENSPKTTELQNKNQLPQHNNLKKQEKLPPNSAKFIKMYLDTSTSTCILKLNEQTYTWEAGHEMAHGILRFIADKLAEQQGTWQNLAEITYFSGPGSFTGLRIGAAVVNTLADQLQIPLFDHHHQPYRVIMPDYGRPAHITPPRK